MDFGVSPLVRESLLRHGWSPERTEDISLVADRLNGAGYLLDGFVWEVLSSLAGLRLEPLVTEGPDFLNEEPFIVDPIGVGVRNKKEADALGAEFGTDFFPLGWWLCRSHVYFGKSGLVVAALPGVVWHLGDSLAEALDFMLTANRPLVRLRSEDGM